MILVEGWKFGNMKLWLFDINLVLDSEKILIGFDRGWTEWKIWNVDDFGCGKLKI